MQVYWLPYLLAFIAYLNVTSRMELELLRSPSGFAPFVISVILMVAGIRAYQIFFLHKRNQIRYEEEPEPLMIGLDYEYPPHKKDQT